MITAVYIATCAFLSILTGLLAMAAGFGPIAAAISGACMGGFWIALYFFGLPKRPE